jgi:exodeoxyribonuclease V alpha subunit
MADLLRAVAPDKTKVLFVGDHGQLPSVGPGAVLRDLLAAEVVPTTRLTKIHRNSGAIVQACHAINTNGEVFPPSVLDPATGKNFRHIEAEDIEQVQQIIRMLVAERMPARGYDPVWDVQTISPTNSRTALSCDGLNDVLQRQLNPNAPATDYGDKCPQWRIGDKVIQTKNAKIKGRDIEIVNGDMGQIIAADTKTLTVKFFLPERIVKLPAKGNNLLLAYCVTCHRMQGSEAKVVIVPVHRTFGPFVTRSWIYTAISRAKDICITVGQFDAFVAAIGRKDSVERSTKLVQRLQQAFVDAEDI